MCIVRTVYLKKNSFGPPLKFFHNDLIALMWARIPLDPDNFKRVIEYQTLRTPFYGGFESVADI